MELDEYSIMTRKAILVTSFGTSYNDTREKTIDALEREVADSFPDYEVRRAWTSRMIIKKLAQRDGVRIDYITEAIDRLSDEGFDEVIVQPTHIMNGEEYDYVADAVETHRGSIGRIVMGTPLLTTSEDYDRTVDAIRSCLVPLAGKRSLVLMGHGTAHYANAAYSELQMKLWSHGADSVFVTTVEGYPGYEDTLRLMEHRGCGKAVVLPFMIVAGDHANNDMAGDDDDSLRSFLTRNGFEVECVIRGLGEFSGFRKLFIEHIRAAIASERDRGGRSAC